MNEQNRLRLPTTVRRALWILAALVVIGAGLFLGWYLVHYRGYDEYRLYVQQPAEKTEAAALKTQKDPENGVPGFALVTQNDNLALYLNEKTAEIALRDRKSGRVVYSNPQDAEESVYPELPGYQFPGRNALELLFQVRGERPGGISPAGERLPGGLYPVQ